VLPRTVVYGITLDALLPSGPLSDATLTPPYCGGSYGSDNCPVGSLNVLLSWEPTDVSVGSDTNPGSIFISSAQTDTSASALGSQDLGYCSGAPTSVLTAFQEVPVDCQNGTAGYSQNASGGLPSMVPAVQFNTFGGPDLYPGGLAQPINFSVTNPGGGTELVNSVTVSILGFTNQHSSAGPACTSAWFTLVQPSAPNGVELAPGSTTVYDPSGASIQLVNEGNIDQDACQGAGILLKFTSN
jgi:hypothetical protein